jgi:ribose 5-phosphate isomerase B
MPNDSLPVVPIPIAIGCDHAGFPLKAAAVAVLTQAGAHVLDCGTDGPARVDYPDFADKVCAAIAQGRARVGVLICGTGNGMAMAANRHPDIRCGYAFDVTSARLTRAHNNANVIALGARLVGEEVAIDILHTFLATAYEGGRHDQRLAKLSQGVFP